MQSALDMLTSMCYTNLHFIIIIIIILKNVLVVLESPGKVLEFFLSKRVGTLFTFMHCSIWRLRHVYC